MEHVYLQNAVTRIGGHHACWVRPHTSEELGRARHRAAQCLIATVGPGRRICTGVVFGAEPQVWAWVEVRGQRFSLPERTLFLRKTISFSELSASLG